MPEPPLHIPLAGLDVRLKDSLGVFTLDVAFRTAADWTVLFGPSGSGKTSVLRAIAGLHQPAFGTIALHRPRMDPLILLDRQRRIDIPAHQRPFRLALQRSTLFPRRTVADNVQYGVGDRLKAATATLERLHLSDLAESPVEQLSGGQAQRVSVARAIAAAQASGPGTWLLLDEPFTGLDLRTRARLTGDLRGWLRELSIHVLSVTHDVAEVFALEAEVIRLDGGRVVAQGSPETVLAEERALVRSAVDRDPAAVHGRPR